ncbi:ethanolamine ammonia-lyase subunit EutC [Pseudonocardia kujensis]|uniref:ethanolamine ammonia-lyase subunit EutC n=1 Tax=Pseudonocardia kujensis TaxID=1128675 RepID=UPI001E47ED86|nr:ethanolamine ammonia-lyase subunit EutC [Pseudonocardia kujensis]MCE0765103.1 ethanolamine ammonia-lyase subunit EutC [Pseudonocardia kujensis]
MTGQPAPRDAFAVLREATQARVALGRAGDALPTSRELAFRVAHAAARDAVHAPLDTAALREALGEALEVRSAAPDRAVYLQRPDLGRRLAEGTALPSTSADLAVVLGDGLSPRALQEHGPGTLAALRERLPGWSIAPPVVARQARVALGDEIGARLGVRAVVVLIGERPGLTAADSLGAYLTWAPRPGRADSERNCVSNIRPPHGTDYAQAADTLAGLLVSARALGASGVALKDQGAKPPTAGLDRSPPKEIR